MWTESMAAWLLTLALHAGVLLALAWIVDRRLPRARLAWRELLWRTALFGGLATSALQVVLQPQTAARLALSAAPAPVAVPAVVVHETAPAAATRPQPSAASAGASTGAVRAHGDSRAASSPQPTVASAAWHPSWQSVVVAGWLAGVALMLARLIGAWLRLRRMLACSQPLGRGREDVATDAAALAIQARIAPPALSVRDDLTSPLAATGRRIVLPGWALGLLEREQVRAMLAHETAHLARRDPAWKLGAAIVCALLWFLPPARLARRRLDELAELACDAWAAAYLGNGRSLAECLAECAERRTGGIDVELAAAMAHRDSPLLQRIGYLIDGYRPQTAVSRLRAAGAVVLAITVAAAVLPGFGPRRAAAQAAPAAPSAPRPPAPPPAPKASEHSHVHITSDGLLGKNREYVQISSEQDGREFSADIKGRIAFSERDDDVASLDEGGSASFTETRQGVERRVDYRNRGGKLERRYFVDGSEQSVDAAAQAWIAAMIPRVIRDTGIGAQARVKRLYASGGANAVLDEIGRIDSGYARGVYLKLLLAQGRLSPAETTRVIGLIDGVDSDYERRNDLIALAAASPLDAAQQKLVIGQAQKIGSDYERAELLLALLPGLAPDAQLRRDWLQAAEAIGSDYEKRRCLDALLKSARLDDATLGQIVASADSISSDYERRQLLVAAVGRVGDGEHIAPFYAKAVSGIGSDYERREALLALIQAPKFGAGAARAVLDASEAIGSDHECREVLVALARVMPNDAGLIERYRSVARRLSDYERGAAERALDRFAG